MMLDVNFHFKTEGFRRIAEAVAPANLTWLEIDTHDAPALALIRRDAPCPIASCETLHARRDFRPYFENYAMDVAIVDVIWNGLAESLKIAAMADVYEMNVAPHNFYGHLCSAISAHFSAAVPNFRIMEIDIDSAPWRDEFYDSVPVIENGEFVLSMQAGLGHRGQREGGARAPAERLTAHLRSESEEQMTDEMAKFKIVTPAGASFTTAGGGYDYEMEALEGMDAEIVEGPDRRGRLHRRRARRRRGLRQGHARSPSRSSTA